jgi:hypothetical protein
LFFVTERTDPLGAEHITPPLPSHEFLRKEVNALVKVKRLVSIGIVFGVLAFPTSTFASSGNSANHQSQTYSAIYQFFSSAFGNKGGSGSDGHQGNNDNKGGYDGRSGNDCWNWGNWSDWCDGQGGKDDHDHDHDGNDCPDSYDIWQQWYCN